MNVTKISKVDLIIEIAKYYGKTKGCRYFSEWASIGKDEGMQKGHLSSVTEMLSLVEPSFKIKFFCY